MTNQLNLEHLVDGYYDWLRSETETKYINGVGVISTPFVDRHNDFIQIYILPEKDNLVLSDLGNTISDLEMCGCNLKTPTRQKLLNETLRSHGVKITHENEISVLANSSNFPIKKHQLLQAILAVNDIFFTARNFVKKLFLEEVNSWLVSNKIRFSPRVSFPGKSGTLSHFDFLISSFETAPERLIKTISNCKVDSARALAFSWIDIEDSRPENTKVYAILNDEDAVDDSALSVLKNYKIQPVLWTERSHFVQELAA